ncbi:phytoene/squalene synthase family protein [uncultured Thiodictyon sp.]|uniref:phytoene/squalene synthase family protein n=1 Tax=uncultured Thiodictyon sp. TaxID=1846217 RepID=UPI0025DE3ED1|nr:phytoene/squalene synthase family protein [uncultured Thiodictyon sp.]
MRQPSLNLRFSTPADQVACRDLLCGGSRSFYAASLLLPRRVYEPATALYAFCRIADDEIDLATRPHDAVIALRQRLDAVYAGRPMQIPADRALADVVHQFAVPRTLLDALIEGFAWDAEGRIYEDISSVYAYSARVAAAVGAMMTLLMGVRDPTLLARACDLGVAMQLSNIARDVGEDAANGRLYLPRQWLREEGLDPDAWLANPVWNPALGRVVARLLAAAEELYARSDEGISRLPLRCRAGIGAARHLYAEIGHEVGRRGMDSICSRAVVSPSRKAQLLPRVLAATLPRRLGSLPPLPETSFLIEAIKAQPLGQSINATSIKPTSIKPMSINPQGVLTPTSPIQIDRPPATVASRVLFVADLFQRLEERDRERRQQYSGMRSPLGSSLSAVSVD